MTQADQHMEVERKFALAAEGAVPDPTDWPGVEAVSAPVRFELDALYFDTPDLRLARAGVTLRRRTGGSDDGWHLKIPSDGDGRLEHGLPLDAGQDTPPEEFVTQVADLTDGEPLQPICRVCTIRVERRLDGATGVLATVCDDTVTTNNLLDPGLDQAWHELEVELAGSGSIEFLDAVTERLAGLGIPQVSIASKLRTALTPPSTGG